MFHTSLSGLWSVYGDTFLHYFQRTLFHSPSFVTNKTHYWGFMAVPTTQIHSVYFMCLCFYTAEQSWRQNTQESGDVLSCAVGAKYSPLPSCYQLFYVAVQCLSCAKLETVGSYTRTHIQVILNRAKHNIMSSVHLVCQPRRRSSAHRMLPSCCLSMFWWHGSPLSSCWKSNVRPPSGKFKKINLTHTFANFPKLPVIITKFYP